MNRQAACVRSSHLTVSVQLMISPDMWKHACRLHTLNLNIKYHLATGLLNPWLLLQAKECSVVNALSTTMFLLLGKTCLHLMGRHFPVCPLKVTCQRPVALPEPLQSIALRAFE